MAFRVTAQDKATNKDQYIIIAFSLVEATTPDIVSSKQLSRLPLEPISNAVAAGD